MAWARTVAVVVPSPATSDVLLATSRTSWAPMFSLGSSSSISLATVTPSLVLVGEPNFFSRTTLRPRGPRVTFTASASLLTPRRIAWRASSLYVIRLAIGLSLHDGENFVLAKNGVFDVVELDLGAGVLPDQHRVALLDVEFDALPILVELPFADGDDFRLLRLLFGGVGDDDSAAHLLLGVFAAHDD